MLEHVKNKRPGWEKRGEPSRNTVVRESGGNERGGSVSEGCGRGSSEDGSSLMQADVEAEKGNKT